MTKTAELIREARKSRKKSQTFVAMRLEGDVPYQLVAYIEKGTRNIPVKHFHRLAEVLHIDKEDLFAAMVFDYAEKLRSKI
jgi:transcriptional regulator with XRE-family HTH domain